MGDARAARLRLAALGELAGLLAVPTDRAALRAALDGFVPARLGVDAWSLALADDESAPTGLASVVLERGEPIRTADHAAECARHGLLADARGLPHWLGAPVVVEGVALGVLSLARRGAPFTAEDELVATAAARLVALALRGVDLAADGTRAAQDLTAAHEEIARGRGLAALGQLATGIVHDFHNTLAAILIRTEILEAECEDDELRRHIEVIHSAALGGARNVRRIRDLAQPRRPRPLKPVDLNEILDDVVAVTRARWRDEAQARDVRYEVTVEARPVPSVAADAVEVGDALTLLIYQTLTDAPDGGRLALSTGVDGERVVCALTASALDGRPLGPGEPPPRVVEIARRHGGDVTAAAAAGKRTVTLSLPAMPRARPPRAAAAAGHRQLRVLIVDDEPAVREALRESLTRLGHVVVACGTGREGIDQVTERPYDVVLTDLSMPDMSGWEVAREIKRARPGLPVALVTGWGDELDHDEAAARGVDALLAKPLTTRTLQAALQSLVRG